MLPSKPTRKPAPASTSQGFAKGGMSPKPMRDPAGSDQNGKSHYKRQPVGLSPSNVPMRKQPGTQEPLGLKTNNSGQHMTSKLKGGAD